MSWQVSTLAVIGIFALLFGWLIGCSIIADAIKTLNK